MKDLILKILEEINFNEDKDEFVNQFLENIKIQTIIDLFELLTDKEKEKFKSELTENSDSSTSINIVLNKFFSDDQIGKAVEGAAKNAISDWMEMIGPALDDDQRQKLLSVSASLV